MKTKLINNKNLKRILRELDGWTGKLTWGLFGEKVAGIVGVESISRHTLLNYPQIVQAFNARKNEIKRKVELNEDKRDLTLEVALAEIDKLTAEVARLEREKNVFVEQFARWQYQLYMMPNVDMDALSARRNDPLPNINRARTW